MTLLGSPHQFMRMTGKSCHFVQPLWLRLMMQWALQVELLLSRFSSPDHIFNYVFEDITILYKMTNDPVIWAILRIICRIDFSKLLWFREKNGFCSHKLIKYPLDIIIIEGIFLFLSFLNSESLVFFLLLDIFVDISTIGWP